jgi:hypothetical protein
MTKYTPLLLLAVAACDAQVDSDHQGQLLASLEGDMHTSLSQTSTTADVSVVWTIGSGGTSFVGADKAETEGMLPNHFTLDVFTLPSDDVMKEWDNETFGAALIAAGPQGVEATDWQSWYGVDLHHVLVYVPTKPVAGGTIAGILHGTPEPGYHLYDVKRLTDAEIQQHYDCITQFLNQNHREPTPAEIHNVCGGDGHDELWPSADDLDTELDIEIVAKFGIPEFNTLPSWYGL